MLEIDIKLLPFQGVTNERALTQGVASLALGYALHWAFSPLILNPKLKYNRSVRDLWSVSVLCYLPINLYICPRRRKCADKASRTGRP